MKSNALRKAKRKATAPTMPFNQHANHYQPSTSTTVSRYLLGVVGLKWAGSCFSNMRCQLSLFLSSTPECYLIYVPNPTFINDETNWYSILNETITCFGWKRHRRMTNVLHFQPVENAS